MTTDPYDRDAELAALRRKVESSRAMGLGYGDRIEAIERRIAEMEAEGGEK